MIDEVSFAARNIAQWATAYREENKLGPERTVIITPTHAGQLLRPQLDDAVFLLDPNIKLSDG